MAVNHPPYIQFHRSGRWCRLGLILMTMGLLSSGLAAPTRAETKRAETKRAETKRAETPATAPNPAPIRIELNQISPLDAGCRLSFMAQNKTGADIAKLVLETVLFDTSGAVMTLSLFDFQTLPDGKPRVRQFDLAGTDCTQLGQVLINGVASCKGSTPADCQNALSLSSRTPNELLG